MDVIHQPLELTVITDAHYYSKKLGIDTEAYRKFNSKNQKLLKDSEEVIKAAFAQIAKSSSPYVIFCGDATCDGDYNSHLEFIELLRALQKCGKRVFAITSTHDYKDDGVTYEYTGSEKKEIPAAKREELFEMYYPFGPAEAAEVYSEGMSYAAELDEGYVLLALNSDKNGSGRSGFSGGHRQWIKEICEKYTAQGKRIIAFTHHPIISPSPFYSLIGKNDMMGEYTEIREELAEMGVNLVFTGHSHVHDISYIFSKSGKVLYDVSTSALAGYPAYIRTVKIDEKGIVVSSEHITEPVSVSFNGDGLQEHLKNQFFGMIERTIKAAANDIHTFAECADAISIRKPFSYKYGWLIKPFAAFINKLTVGTVAKWTRAETGLTDEEIDSVKDESVVSFIVDLVAHLFEGDAPYGPDDPKYKITVGLMNIINSLLKTIHLPFSKLVKGFEHPAELFIPLLYNSGICDRAAVLPYSPAQAELEKLFDRRTADVKESRKGPYILAVLILLVILLIPFVPLIALGLGAGYLINRIKYSKQIRGIEE